VIPNGQYQIWSSIGYARARREIILSLFEQGFKYREIAIMIRCSIGLVGQKVARARRERGNERIEDCPVCGNYLETEHDGWFCENCRLERERAR
jgi:transposase